MEVNIEFYKLRSGYSRNGKRCLFDPIREMLVIETPEEIVRQKLIMFLQEKMDIPRKMIMVEVPISKFKKGSKGRADIVVLGYHDKETLMPVLVIECKAPEVVLTDNVYGQVEYYNEILGADTIMITNGKELLVWSWDDEREKFGELLELPKYKILLEKQDFVFDISEPNIWQRPPFSKILNEKVVEEFKEQGTIGEGTDRSLYKFIINLAGFLLDDTEKLTPQVLNDINIVEDGGIRYTSFGNAAGGRWPGEYRYFVIEDEHQNNQVISMAIMASLKCENDPKFGNSKGYSVLIVAIDDFDKSHNSLQLNIDNYTSVKNNNVTVWHDGRMAVGNLGAVKRNDVVNFIKIKAPELVNRDGKIILGVFNNDKEIDWNLKETKDFIGRVIKYALLRDEFRKQLKMSKKKNSSTSGGRQSLLKETNHSRSSNSLLKSIMQRIIKWVLGK